MNIDRMMLILVVIAVVAIRVAMYVSGALGGEFFWWKLPLGLAVGFGLQAVLGAARRRNLLDKTSSTFLATVPMAMAVTLVIGIDQNVSLTRLLWGFVFVEAVFLALTLICWLVARNEGSPETPRP